MSLKISAATNIASPGNPPGDADVLPVERPSNNTPMKISLLNIFNYVWGKITKDLITTRIGAKTNPSSGDIPVLGSAGNLLPDGLALKQVSFSGDLDDFYTPVNSFTVGTAFTNSPDSLSGNAIVIITGNSSNSLNQEFRYIGGSNIRIFNRQRIGTTWSTWLESFTTGNVSTITLGNAATVGGHPASDFATAAQGAKADTALQSGTGLVPSTSLSVGSYIWGVGTIAIGIGNTFDAATYPIMDSSSGTEPIATTGIWRSHTASSFNTTSQGLFQRIS